MNRPLVSVVVATYNMGAYVSLAVRSILEGTWAELEVIVVDDGSTDDTPDCLKDVLTDSRVRLIRQSNQGQPRAKNRGLREANGEFIAFCDADDLWEPEKLVLQMPRFADPRVGVVYSEVSFMDETGERYEKAPAYERFSGQVTNQLLIKNFVPFGTSVIRRACLERNGVFDERFKMGIDWDLWLRVSLDWEFSYISDRTYVYREWSGQMSNNYRGRYEFAERILRNFEATNGNRVQPSALRKAWADFHVSRADVYAQNERATLRPLADAVRGTLLDPLNLVGWKVLTKILLRWYR